MSHSHIVIQVIILGLNTVYFETPSEHKLVILLLAKSIFDKSQFKLFPISGIFPKHPDEDSIIISTL